MITKLTITASAIVLGMGMVRPMSWAAEGDQGRAYCGSCHGVEGKGDGTVSRSLKVRPADLTQLKKRNKGVFPLDKVIATIDGKTRIGAHGESKMPVWGEIFEKEASAQKEPATTSAARVKLRQSLNTFPRSSAEWGRISATVCSVFFPTFLPAAPLAPQTRTDSPS